MGEKINHLLKKPLYPYLYGVAFIIFKSSQYFPSFSLLTAINCLFLFCLSTYLLKLLLSRFNSSVYTGVSVMILWGSILHVAFIAQVLGYSYSYIPIYFYIFFYPLIICIVILCQQFSVKLSNQYALSLNKVANVFLLVISIVFIVYGYVYGGWKKDAKRTYTKIIYKPVAEKKRRDIVWLLADEYASSTSLKHQFAFDNPLDSILQKEGFCVLKTMKSRFNNTLFSLNAIFNEDDSIMPSSFYAGTRLLKKSSWEPLLEASGYQFINLGLFDIGCHNKLADRSGYPQTYVHQLFSGTVFSMLYSDLKYTLGNCDAYNLEVLQKLGDTLRAKTNQPKFIWAHISIPHEPFCRNSHGTLLKGKTYTQSDSAFIKKSYIEYLQYGNSVITQLIKAYPELLQKILVISGDHGPRYSFLRDKSYQKWPFAAVMIPESYDTVSLHKLKYISQMPAFIMHHLSN